MAGFGWEGAGQGASAGAATGAAIGAAGGAKGAIIGAGVGAVVGGVAGGFAAGKKKRNGVDIQGELARIRSLYSRISAQARANVLKSAGAESGVIASNLAARGIYSSPVSENVFARHRAETAGNLSDVESQIAGRQADAESQILQSLVGAQQAREEANALARDQERAQIFAGLGSLGSTLLKSGMSRPSPSVATTQGLPPTLSPSGSPFATNTQGLYPTQQQPNQAYLMALRRLYGMRS